LLLSQEGLWVLHQLQPDIPLYNESILFRLTGKLNRVALEQSLNEIIRRHERTRFQVVEGQPVQIIAPPNFNPASRRSPGDTVNRAGSQGQTGGNPGFSHPFDLSERVTTAGHPAAVERGACHALDHASHYLRWLVTKVFFQS